MKPILTTILAIFASLIAFSQADTEFWFVAPEASNQHGDSPIYLRLAGLGATAAVTISLPADPTFPTITQNVPASNLTSINLTAYLGKIENMPPNQVLTKGILIQATEPIMAYYEIANTFNPEIFPLKGRNALGTEFYTPAQNIFPNQVGNSHIDIVATEDGTVVSITPTADITGHAANIPFSITLNQGETFSCRGTSVAAFVHLGGTFITSTKPIAVTISDDSIFSQGSYDIIGDQLVPVPLLGTEYIAVKGHMNDERVFIVAIQDGTDIFIDGSTTAITTLSRGQLYSVPIGASATSKYIQSSYPIYAYHLSGHSNEIGDALLPPIACTGSEEVSFVRSGNDPFSIMLLTEDANKSNFTLNGNALALTWSPVPGNSTWVSARMDAPTSIAPVGVNRLVNTSGLFHVGILYSFDNFSSEYGYFSNYSSLNVGDDKVICEGDQVILDAGEGKSSYMWNTGDTTRYLTVTEQDTYWIEATFYNCLLTDSIIIEVNEMDLGIGADLWTCAGEDTLFTSMTTIQNATYTWQDGSNDTFFVALDTGMVHLTIADTLGCEISDTANFQYYPVIELGNDTSFVCDSITFWIESNLTNASYLWHDGSTDSTYFVTTDGWFWVDAVDENYCFSSDTVYVAFVNSPILNLGLDTIVCPDNLVSMDATIPAGVGYLWQDGTLGPLYTADTAGIYVVRAVDTTTCYTWDTLIVENFYVPDSLFEPDTTICNTSTYLLEPMIDNPATFSWQDGSSGSSFLVESQGTYWISIIDNNDCPSTDTIFVDYLNDPLDWHLPPDTTVCFRDSVWLDATQAEATHYEWTGFSTYYGQNDYNDSIFLVRVAGTYEVAITNFCGTIVQTIEVINDDCDCEPFVPNAFSPNGDGINDKFEIYSSCDITNAELSLFDRKGSLLYHTTDVSTGWDGIFKNKIVPTGVYIWQLKFDAENKMGEVVSKLMAGDVTVMR